MKRIFCFIALMSICAVVTYAQKNFNAGQKALNDNIFAYLQNEGYVPSIDSDGDIKFKRNGDIYYVIIRPEETSPYFIRLQKYFSYGTRVTKQNILKYVKEVNSYKMLKCTFTDEQYVLTSEMFLSNSSSFTLIFNRLLRVFDAAEDEFNQTL